MSAYLILLPNGLELDFEGVRVDIPLDLINFRELFTEFREYVKSGFPGAYIAGEIWEQRPEWVNEGHSTR